MEDLFEGLVRIIFGILAAPIVFVAHRYFKRRNRMRTRQLTELGFASSTQAYSWRDSTQLILLGYRCSPLRTMYSHHGMDLGIFLF